MSTFHIADYVIFAISIVASLAIGIYLACSGQRPKTNTQYLTGDRKMHIVPVAISLVVSFVSTIDILGNPAEVYIYGTQYMWYILATVIGILCGTFLFVPLYYPLNITSIFQYTRMRFHSKCLEYFVVSLALLHMVCCLFSTTYINLVYYRSSSSLSAYSQRNNDLRALCGLSGRYVNRYLFLYIVSGFPAWASIIICGVTATVYTTLGGIKAVVWTDVFQAGIIILGLVAVVVKGTLEVGSVYDVWEINRRWNRVQAPDFRFDPTIRLTFWSVCVMNSFLWMTIVGSQSSVQRFISLPSMKKAKLSTLLIIPGFLLSGMLTCTCGVTAFAYYAKKGCDPVNSGILSSPNQILPFFVMEVLDMPGLPGLFIASLFSASLSSISTIYNGMSAIIWLNVLTHKYGHLSTKTQANITKLCSIGSTINKTIDKPLPGPIHNCSFLGASTRLIDNSTSDNVMGERDNETLGRLNDDNITLLTGPSDRDRSSFTVMWFYSVSYFYYPFVGITIVFIVCLLTLPIRGLKSPVPTQKKYLFPCLRRHFGVPNEKDEKRDQSQIGCE
ncbi:hypothetical protein LSH36_74g13000 [Paralvinella palmiformis]|uniref:Sodium-coupled monocarboxylate transporter 1 n=1 Tax=Paralvinella palmiformis TaxID=53620 RepID=A0AAD9K3D4_9ANNE|nr:hypothetical protein LSH36_74g13000 [Paralvinella palmiformis]